MIDHTGDRAIEEQQDGSIRESRMQVDDQTHADLEQTLANADAGARPDPAAERDAAAHARDMHDRPPEDATQDRSPGNEQPPPIDGAGARELVAGWTGAFNRRDLDALVALADPDIAYHPTILAHGPRVYHGHDGLRAWLADLDCANAHHTVTVTETRVSAISRLIVFGDIVDEGEVISPYAMLFRLTGRRVIEAHAYLSDEPMMQSLGLIDD